nr:MAG TPA: hypothetical protein [Caudoviricetes sp.]
MAGEKTQRSREQYAARTKQPKNQGRKVAPSMRHQKRRALPLGNGIAPP